MPIDAGDLVKSEEREIINSSASDLNVEVLGLGKIRRKMGTRKRGGW